MGALPQRILTSCLCHFVFCQHTTMTMLNDVGILSREVTTANCHTLNKQKKDVVCRTLSKRNSKPQHQPKASTVVLRPVEMSSLQRSGVAENCHRTRHSRFGHEG